MTFKFRYASLLSYRQYQKEKAEIEHAKALGVLLQAREELSSLERKNERVQGALRKAMAGEIGGYEIRNYSEYLDFIRERTAEQNRKIEVLEHEMGKKRVVLLEKSKDFKVIEKLRDKDFEKWKKHQDHLEQKRLNEVSVQRYGRAFV